MATKNITCFLFFLSSTVRINFPIKIDANITNKHCDKRTKECAFIKLISPLETMLKILPINPLEIKPYE